MKPRKKAKGKTVKFSGHPQEVCRAVCQGGGGEGELSYKSDRDVGVAQATREISVWSVSGQLNRASLIL